MPTIAFNARYWIVFYSNLIISVYSAVNKIKRYFSLTINLKITPLSLQKIHYQKLRFTTYT